MSFTERKQAVKQKKAQTNSFVSVSSKSGTNISWFELIDKLVVAHFGSYSPIFTFILIFLGPLLTTQIMSQVLAPLTVFFLLKLVAPVDTSFSFGFRKFLWTAYGPDVQLNLTRLDFIDRGSFGGGVRSYPAKTK